MSTMLRSQSPGPMIGALNSGVAADRFQTWPSAGFRQPRTLLRDSHTGGCNDVVTWRRRPALRRGSGASPPHSPPVGHRVHTPASVHDGTAKSRDPGAGPRRFRCPPERFVNNALTPSRLPERSWSTWSLTFDTKQISTWASTRESNQRWPGCGSWSVPLFGRILRAGERADRTSGHGLLQGWIDPAGAWSFDSLTPERLRPNGWVGAQRRNLPSVGQADLVETLPSCPSWRIGSGSPSMSR